MRFNRLFPSIGAILLIGVFWVSMWSDSTATRNAAAQASAHVARQPVPVDVQSRAMPVGSNELLVLDVPSRATPEAPIVEIQRCYVWRDADFKTSSLTCPSSDEGAVQLALPPPSFER